MQTDMSMKTEPLASIIVNNYNYERYLAEAIDSALEQTYPSVEVVVVDDGSTDNSQEIIASYGDRIVPILKENGGQVSVFNVGFRAGRGDIVCFLDADDTLLPSAMEKVVERFEDPEVSKVHWPLWVVDESGGMTGTVEPRHGVPEGDMREDVLARGPDNPSWPPTSGNAWRRRFLERVVPLPETDFELVPVFADAYLNMLAPLFGRIARITDPQACYRLHDSNDHYRATFDERLKRDLQRFDHRSAILSGYCRDMGLEPDEAAWKAQSWYQRLKSAMEDLAGIVPPGSTFALADEGVWGMDRHAEYKVVPFPERGGVYWGAPPDDATAIDELERVRKGGADFLVVAWPAFWWLEHYTTFIRYLRSHFSCLLENERVVIFDVRRGSP
ncbi:MAG TPA: glycosyltransferase [Chloroflexota bacterium]